MAYRRIINIAIIPIALAFFPPEHYQELYNDDFPADYNPDKNSFDGIYERRDNFDVETPMEFPSESKPEAEDLNDDQLEASEESDYPSYSPEGNGDYASESQTDSSSSFLSDGCLRCLCEASSDCDPQMRCHVEGPVDYYCGAFQINFNYWNDAGSPGSDQHDPLDFEECMNDIECSIDTVNGYMRKWGKDCDGDGRISCDDYAKIHKAGSYQCNSTWVLDTPFWNKYRECFFEYK